MLAFDFANLISVNYLPRPMSAGKFYAIFFSILMILGTSGYVIGSSTASSGNSEPPADIAKNWEVSEDFTRTNNRDNSLFKIGGFDEDDNMYIATMSNSNPYTPMGFGISSETSGIRVSKVAENGALQWTHHLGMYGIWQDLAGKIFLDSIEVINPDEFYLIFTVETGSSGQIIYDPINGNLPRIHLGGGGFYTIVIYHNATTNWFEWSEIITHSDIPNVGQNIVEHVLDDDNNLIITSANQYPNTPMKYVVTSFNNTGLKWQKNLLASEIVHDYTMLTDVVGTDIHYLLQTKANQSSFDNQSISCPNNSEFDICYAWLTINSNGVLTKTLLKENPRVTFTSFAVINDNARLVGISGYVNSSLCPLSCNTTNFTGTPNLGEENADSIRNLVFASLNGTTANWSFSETTNFNLPFWYKDSNVDQQLVTKGLIPNQQNVLYHSNGSITYLYSCLRTLWSGQECESEFNYTGVNISLGNLRNSQLAFFMLDSNGTYQWHQTIGFNVSSSNPVLPIKNYNAIFSKKYRFSALYVNYGGSNSVPILIGNETLIQSFNVSNHSGLLLWINGIDGSLIDIEYPISDVYDQYAEKQMNPIAITPKGNTLTASELLWKEEFGYNDHYHYFGIDVNQEFKPYFHSFGFDNDNDNISNLYDNCIDVFNTNQSNYEGDSHGDLCDLDDDNDGISDDIDYCQFSINTNWISEINLTRPELTTDWDTDGCEDSTPEDQDDDNDGILDLYDVCPKGIVGLGGDYDQEGCKDAEDSDDDNDSILDVDDSCQKGDIGWEVGIVTDYDGDGCQDDLEDDDDDNDGVVDDYDLCPKGLMDWQSNSNTDFNGDGCLDSVEDEDNDDDGIQNFADLCQYSQGEVDENGCTMAQLLLMDSSDDSDNNSLPSMMFVCPGGLAVVLDLADCPPVEEDNETMPVIMYVCSGGTAVVSNLADCPQSNDNSTTNQPEDQNAAQAPSFYYVCYGGGMVVQNLTDCPENGTKDEGDSNTNVVSSGSDSDDNTLLIMVGGAFILSIISMLVGLLRSSNSSKEEISGLTQEFEKSHDLDFELSDNNDSIMPIEEPSAEENSTEEAETEDKPPIFVNGTPNEGYEWIKWPEGSGQDWYREIDSNGEWMKWE